MHDQINNCDVAVKVVSNKYGPINSEMMKKEVIALSNLQHKNIVKLMDSFPIKDQLIVIMEYLEGGELLEYWKRFPNRRMPEIEACEIILQLM